MLELETWAIFLNIFMTAFVIFFFFFLSQEMSSFEESNARLSSTSKVFLGISIGVRLTEFIC